MSPNSTPLGVHQWTTTFGGTGKATAGYGVAVDGSGNVHVTGDFAGTVELRGRQRHRRRRPRRVCHQTQLCWCPPVDHHLRRQPAAPPPV
ncbi:MAG: SBBP repeat-containing protein [Candidatus Poriferisodalaceae bacterium]